MGKNDGSIIELENKIIIGQKEKVDFPDFGRHGITARVDTGAKSCSVHCSKIWVEKMMGKDILCCYLFNNAHKVTRFSTFHKRKVKSSNGIYQSRYVAPLKIRLGTIEKITPVTFNNRSEMNYSVLLGRRFLSPEFLVDVATSYLFTKKNIRK